MIEREIERIIVIGRGSILKSCLGIAAQAYPDAKGEIYEPQKKAEMMEYLRAVKEKSLIISVMNPYIIAEDVVEMTNLLIINVHHALLPKHPGLNAVAWTIWAGDKEGGITWHYVDSGIDSGKIILRKAVAIDENTSSSRLMQKSKILMLDGLKEILPLKENAVQADSAEKCPEEKSEEKPHGPKDTINGAVLDLSWDFTTASRFLRAMDFGFLHPMGIPLIKSDDMEFEILSYTLKKEKNKINGISEIRRSEEKDTIKILYADGEIELRVKSG